MCFILLVTLIFLNLCFLKGENLPNNGCRWDDNVTITCSNIPKDIPVGTLKFHLHIETPQTLVLNSSTFPGENWGKLQNLEFTEVEDTDLVFKDGCFNGLASLVELHIHVWAPKLFMNSFSSLEHVKTLDFTGCGRLRIEDVKLSIRRSNILPQLHKIVLSEWNSYKGSYAFDDDLVETFLPRNITEIDISRSQVSFLNGTAVFKKIQHLEVLNASHTTISDTQDTGLVQEDLKHIKVADFSNAILPHKTITFLHAKFVLHNVKGYLSDFKLFNDFRNGLSPETVNGSGIVPLFTSLWLYNVTAIIDKDPSFFTKTIKLQQNNLKRLDVRLICDHFYILSVQTIDISDNGMEFLHPTLLSCFKNLLSIDLSKNQLFKMVEENSTLFQNLFSRLEYLRFIRMSANGLYKIPTQLFHNCKSIEEVDLSYNRIEQVTFTLNDLENLEVLNLQGNNIHALDSLSIHFLNSIPHGSNVKTSNTTVILKSNPILCSVCETKPFLQWLVSTCLINTVSQGMTCLDENSKQHDINGNTVEMVQKTCERKTIIISTSISAAAIFCISILCVIIIYNRHKQKRKIQNRTNVINNLRDGEGQSQFAVFLSFSNKDEQFVYTHILDQLNENLPLMTGIDRTLVCTGDQHFRPGFNIHDETFRLLDAASVLIVVVSNNFLAGDFCLSELDNAYDYGKPIVLMLIEEVDPDLMTPKMKALYRKNTRILWKVENGEYVLKTSWENVCASVLDLIICDL